MAIDAPMRRTIHDVVLRITGDDARSWLSGQVTNDVRSLTPGGAIYTLVLNTRGKILSDAWALDRDGELLLLVPERVSAEVRAHLEDHVIMEDVALEPTGESVTWALGAIEGFPCDPLGLGARVLLGPCEPAGPEIDDAAWKLERLRRGVPELGADFGLDNYPQEAGLKAAVSFEKGCYLGQEVVCMLENRGQLTRRLVMLDGPAIEGAALHDGGKVVGTVTSAASDPETGKTVALGYVKRAAAVPGAFVQGEGGPIGIVAIVGDPHAGLREAPAL